MATTNIDSLTPPGMDEQNKKPKAKQAAASTNAPSTAVQTSSPSATASLISPQPSYSTSPNVQPTSMRVSMSPTAASNNAQGASSTAAQTNAQTSASPTATTQTNTSPTATTQASAPPNTASQSTLRQLASRAANLGKKAANFLSSVAGADQLVKGGYGLLADAGVLTPPKDYERRSTVDNAIRTAVGAGSFVPGAAPFARAVAGGMALADMMPDSVYKAGLKSMGLIPDQDSIAGPALNEYLNSKLALPSSANIPQQPASTLNSAKPAIVLAKVPDVVDDSLNSIPALGTGWIQNTRTGKITKIGSAQPVAQQPVQQPVRQQSTNLTPPRLVVPTIPTLSTSGGIMSAMANFVRDASIAANQIAANNIAQKMFRNQLAIENQKNANDLARTKMALSNLQEQSAGIDLEQKKRIDELQRAYLNAEPEQRSKIARELALYTGKNPAARHYERVRSAIQDQYGNPVPIDYLYDIDSGVWLTPPPLQKEPTPISNGLRVDPKTGKVLKVENGAVTVLN